MHTRGSGDALAPGCSCSIPANPSLHEEQQPVALSRGFLGTGVQAEPTGAPRCQSKTPTAAAAAPSARGAGAGCRRRAGERGAPCQRKPPENSSVAEPAAEGKAEPPPASVAGNAGIAAR